jgi:hypothetical protein
MAPDHLLLPGATSGILVSPKRGPHWVRIVAISLGILTVLIGGADMFSRVSEKVLGCSAQNLTFGPAIGALDPSALSSAGATEPCE